MAETDEPRPYSTLVPQNPVPGPQKMASPYPPSWSPNFVFSDQKSEVPPRHGEKRLFFHENGDTPIFLDQKFRPPTQKFRSGPKISTPNASIDLEAGPQKSTPGPIFSIPKTSRSVQEGGRHVFLTNTRRKTIGLLNTPDIPPLPLPPPVDSLVSGGGGGAFRYCKKFLTVLLDFFL